MKEWEPSFKKAGFDILEHCRPREQVVVTIWSAPGAAGKVKPSFSMKKLERQPPERTAALWWFVLTRFVPSLLYAANPKPKEATVPSIDDFPKIDSPDGAEYDLYKKAYAEAKKQIIAGREPNCGLREDELRPFESIAIVNGAVALAIGNLNKRLTDVQNYCGKLPEQPKS